MVAAGPQGPSDHRRLPGYVDALAKGSEHYQGLRIEGGVNLGL